VNLGEPKEGALVKRVGAFWGRFMGWETHEWRVFCEQHE